MKIFGVGLSRTGTWSLTRAVAELGFDAIHFPRPPVAKGVLECAEIHDAVFDIPVILVYQGLAKKYPNAKFILTIRDIGSWLVSCKHHFDRPLGGDVGRLRTQIYGRNVFDADRFTQAYREHIQDVLAHFGPDSSRLLVMNIIDGDGYELLCPFLNLPLIHGAFPHINKGDYATDST